MSRYVQFDTPENIEVSYELAGIGSRFLACLIDSVIQLGLVVMIVIAFSYVGHISSAAFRHGSVPGWFDAFAGLAAFCILFGYYAIFELTWRGQTPGKKFAKIRVVRDGGYPIDLYSSATRNLVRIVDLLPPPYGIGLLTIFVNSEYKRLGDLAAGTLVIKERPVAYLGERSRGSASPMAAHFAPLIKNIDAITKEEFHTLRKFTDRRHELEIPIQAHIAMRLAIPLIQKLGLEVDIPVQWHYADLLEAIERRYIEERGIL